MSYLVISLKFEPLLVVKYLDLENRYCFEENKQYTQFSLSYSFGHFQWRALSVECSTGLVYVFFFPACIGYISMIVKLLCLCAIIP